MIARLASIAFALGVPLCLGWGFIKTSSPTYDEPVHLASGYVALKTPLRPINYRDHPPLAEMAAALPLLALKPALMTQHPQFGRLYNYADAFLHQNTVPAERLLSTARLWSLVLWTAAVALPALEWAGRLAGPVGAAAAAALSAFCPALFSNAALVATDSAAAALFFMTFWLLSFNPRRRRHWALAGFCAGLALGAKFSMVVIPPFAAAALLMERKLDGGSGRFDWAGAAVSVVALLLSLLFVYKFRGLGLWWEGFTATMSRLDQGRSAYLLGQYSTTGWWYYFPVALLVKTPLPLLALAALGAASWLRVPRSQQLWVWGPAAAYFVLACFSKTQIGYRHILPVYPSLILLGAVGAEKLFRRGRAARLLLMLFGGWLVYGVFKTHPHHLAYFNELAAGPEGGRRWLADSNLDWGQDLPALARELKARGNPAIYFSYFGAGDPSLYGIRYLPVGFVSNVDRRDGVALPDPRGQVLLAVSATNLVGVYYRDKAAFAWLGERRPCFSAGHSILLYDLSSDAEGRRRLAELLRGLGHAGTADGLLLK